MPIYEYHCEPCNETFEALIRSSSDVAHCPSCGSPEVDKQFSVPAAAQVGGSPGSSPLPMASAGDCGAPACGGGVCQFDGA